MKKLNRILSLSAAAALALSLTACSGGPSGTADTPAEPISGLIFP